MCMFYLKESKCSWWFTILGKDYFHTKGPRELDNKINQSQVTPTPTQPQALHSLLLFIPVLRHPHGRSSFSRSHTLLPDPSCAFSFSFLSEHSN